MATYYKYAERAAGSQVNWAEIGKNLTDTLSEENKLREQKKAAIDEASRQYGITLENSPQGEDKSFNQWGLDFAGDAQEARLLQDRLLKSGKLKLKDYTMMRQNLTDGTKIAFDLVNEYNAEKKVREERAKSMDPAAASQYLEQWMAAQAEAFANYKDSKLYINPTTFSVSVGRNFVTKDGVTTMSDNPNDYTTVNELRNRIKTKFDKFDSSGYLKKRVDLLGTEQRATIAAAATRSKAGFTKSTEDVTLKDSFQAYQDGIINEAFANPLNISSVLTNNLAMDKDGNIYDFSFNEKDMGLVKDGKNYIYMKKNEDGSYEPQFTTDQRDAAVKDMKNQMNSMLDYKETVQTYNNPAPIQRSQWEAEFAKDKNKQMELGRMLAYLHSGTPEQIQTAVDYFGTVNPQGMKNIRRHNSGVEYTDANGTVVPIKLKQDMKEFVRSSIGQFVGGDADITAMLEGAEKAGIEKKVYQSWTNDPSGINYDFKNKGYQYVEPTTTPTPAPASTTGGAKPGDLLFKIN
jgi:hypothetical protein